jgi:predicted aspartyl protease
VSIERAYNPIDYAEFVRRRRRLEGVKRIGLKALVDAGATFPALPEDVVEKLGLPFMAGLRLRQLLAGRR